jgi:hypothetical protein
VRGHAVIVGWAGSTERHLRGVASFHRSLGLEPIVVAPRVFRAMSLPWGWRREGEALAARLIDAIDHEPGPIVVHAFSNAGFWTYAATLRALAQRREGRRVLDRIGALALDSAPGFPPHIRSRFAARSSAMAMMPLVLRALGRPPALSHPLLDPPLRAFMWLWVHASPLQIRRMEASLALVRDTGDWPILLLGSSADALVPIEHVVAFAATLGARASTVRWEDSEHVRHMIVHRQAYFEAVHALCDRARSEQ